MTIADILNIEDDNTDRIYLFHEGTFLKAYEHSAFLFHRHVSNFKLSCSFIKSVNSWVISLGFPQSVLGRWIRNCPVREDKYTVQTSLIERQPVFKTAYDQYLDVVRRIYDAPDRDAAIDRVGETCSRLLF